MKTIKAQQITDAIRDAFIEANYRLPADAEACIRRAPDGETNPLAKSILTRLGENMDAARAANVPICQDTGMAVVFAEVGCDVHIDGDFTEAVNAGVRAAYLDGYMRLSVVRDPFYDRTNTGDNTPAVIHVRLVAGDRLKLTVAPKGFGSENMSAIKLFTPSATEDEIVTFVADTVKRAGGNPCPPLLIGVGIGGTFDYAAVMAKHALTRPVSKQNPHAQYAALEAKMLAAVNATGVGPQGFGGDTTALAVHIEHYPTHIAGLPVAVNINCHVMRHAEVEL